MIGHVFNELLSWPDGIIVGNLIASAVWAFPAVLHLDRLARKHHAEHMTLLHKQHSEHMTALREKL